MDATTYPLGGGVDASLLLEALVSSSLLLLGEGFLEALGNDPAHDVVLVYVREGRCSHAVLQGREDGTRVRAKDREE